MHSWAPVVATAGGVALAIGGLTAVGSSGEQRLSVATSYGEGDGLHHYVVTLAGPEGATTAASGTTAPGGGTSASAPAGSSVDAGPATGQGGPRATRLAVDAGLLRSAQAELGAGGDVIADGAAVYYVTPLGARAINAGATAGPVPVGAAVLVPTAAPVIAESVLAALAERPGVHAVTPLDIGGDAVVTTDLDLTAILALPEVAAAEPSVEVPVLGLDPTDPYYGPYGWNLHNTGSNAYGSSATAGSDVDAPTGWQTTQGQDTVVAVVDTGFDSDHPELAGALWTSPTEGCGAQDSNGNGLAGDCHGWNFWAGTADVDNGAGGSHGSAVSGTVAARRDNGQGSVGLAPRTQIMPLVVGSGESVDVYLAAQAIRYAADNGADVVNASFGGAFTGQALTALSAAVDYAIDRGVVVVAAAGNDSADRDASPVYPASLPNPLLLTVGSSTPTDTVAAHSAFGAASVDVFAPGEAIVVPWNDGGYRVVAGTSFAAPHVAATAALYRSVNPLQPVADLRTSLLADAERLPSMAGRSATGGRLSVGAVRGVLDEDVRYSFAGMVGTPGVQHPQVTVSSAAGNGSYQAVVGLAMLVDGEIWAVAGQEMTVAGVALTTDDAGQVRIDLGAQAFLGTEVIAPEIELGAGSFGLTVQILLDGQPLGRPRAAPLVVRVSADDGAGGSGDAGSDEDGGADDGASGTGEAPGGAGDGGVGDGASGDGTGQAPGGTGNGGTDDGGSSSPGSGGAGDAGSGPPGGADPGSGPGPSDDGAGGSGGGTDPGSDLAPSPPGGTEPWPGVDPAPTVPSSPVTAPVPSTEPDATSYDEIGYFRVTRIAPVHVPTAGGALVVVSARALEAGTGVRVGATTPAHVVFVSPTTLVFFSPPAVAGTYDVTLFHHWRTSVLPGALVVGDPTSGRTTTPTPGTGGSEPGSQGSGGPGATDPSAGAGGPAAGSSGPASGGGAGSGGSGGSGGTGSGAPDGSGDSGSGGSGDDDASGDDTGPDGDAGSGGGTTPTTPAATRVGPNGERLIRADALASLSGLWALSCTVTCTGTQA